MMLVGITLSLRPKRVLELGVGYGTSTLSLLEGVYLTEGFLDSVDTEELFRCPDIFKNHWKFHKSDSVRFLKNAKDIKYDLIFIDDLHEEDHVALELKLIEPLIDKSSVILLHDSMPRSVPEYSFNKNFGVASVIHSLPRDKWEFSTIPVCNGLTILRKIV